MPEPGFPALADDITAALAEITADDDPLHAYQRASELGTVGRDLLARSARARGRALEALRRAGGMTVTEVAARVGISKARASDLIRDAGAPPGHNESRFTAY